MYKGINKLIKINIIWTINLPDECACRTLKGHIVFTFTVVNCNDRLIGAIDIFLVKLLTMLDILKECPNDLIKVFMININYLIDIIIV